jgi:predicted nucleic acid-binding protein
MRYIYLDVCCLNRPFDDQTQDRIRLESEAVILILTHIEAGEWEWASSDVVNYEIEQNPNEERKARVKALIKSSNNNIPLQQTEIDRAQELEKLGFKAIDALHIACAETENVEVMLTTDDKLLNLAKKCTKQLHIRVANPLTWLEEVIKK